MRRNLALIGVAAFVLIDATLIGFAMNHAAATPGGSTVVVTQTVGASPRSTIVRSATTGAQSTSPPVPASKDPSAATAPGTRASPAPASPTPASTTSAQPPDTGTTAAAASGNGTSTPEGRMLLDMSSDGSVIRAAAGDCKGSKPSTVELSTDWGKSWKSAGVDVRQVLRVSARKDGNVWFVGAGADCTPAMHEAKDLAVSRPAGGNDGVWYLSTDAASTTVKAPDVPVDSGCVPIGLEPIDAQAAYILCANRAIRVTEDGGRSWQTRSTVVGAASISFTDAKSGFALAPTSECPAAVLATTDSGATWTRRACLKGAVPQAITAAGGRMLVLIDGRMQSSEDAGVSWRPIR